MAARLRRRTFIGRSANLFVGVASAVVPLAGLAQALDAPGYPSRPMRLVLAYPPGGVTDVLARLLAQKLSERLGKPVVVENRPGGNGVIATEMAAKSAPDGLTLFMGTIGEMAINPHLQKVSYSPEKDFAPVAMLAVSPLVVVVHPSMPVKSYRDLVAFAKANPGKLSYLSVGEGSAQHLSGEIVKHAAGIDIVHVPFKGGPPQVVALLAGQDPQFGFVTLGSAIPHIQSGKLRALAVSTESRVSLLPEVPTLREEGLADFDTGSWFALFVPTGTSAGIVNVLRVEATRVVQMPDVRARLAEAGLEVRTGSPEQLGRFVRSENDKYRQAIKDAGMKTDSGRN